MPFAAYAAICCCYVRPRKQARGDARACPGVVRTNLAEVVMTKIFRALWFSVVVTTLCGIALAQLPVTDDSYVTSAQPTTNNGNSTSLVVQQASNGTTLIKVDLTQLQAAGVTGSQISKAYLKVYATAVTGQGTFDLYQITSSWQESTVTYNTKPSMILVTAGATCPSGTQCINASSKYY